MNQPSQTQPTCTACGEYLVTGMIKGPDGINRFGVKPCAKCNKVCPHCGGSGIAPDAGKPATPPTP